MIARLSKGKIKVIAVVGPTASGKTGLAIALAKRFKGEVVSADSRQVYTGLDIGTGKVTKKEMGGIRHHLLDVADPRRQYSVARYAKAARTAIKEIASRDHVPIVCGGTGFYVDALLFETKLPEVKPNATLRKRLGKLSAEKLFAMLKKKDAARAENIDPYNKVRLIRAVEIIEALGKVPAPSAAESSYEILWIGLKPREQVLEKKIRRRLLARMKLGMIGEAKRLRAQGLSWKRMDMLGLEYRFLAQHLQGTLSREEMTDQLEKEIRRYAKRQMTWFKRNGEIAWFEPGKTGTIVAKARKFLAM